MEEPASALTSTTGTDTPGLALEVIRGEARGVLIPMREGELALGRDDAALALLPADNTMSRTHALIIRSGPGRFTISDQGSANGTFVNGTRTDGEVPLVFGDELQVGRTLFLVVVDTGDQTRLMPAVSPPQRRGHRPGRVRGNVTALPTADGPGVRGATPVADGPSPWAAAPAAASAGGQDPPGYAQALALFRAGDVSGALRLLVVCHRGDPRHFGTLYGLGMCYARLGDPSQARHWLQAAQASDPTHAGVAGALAALNASVQPTAPGGSSSASGGGRPTGDPPTGGPGDPASKPRRKPSLAAELDGDDPIDANRLPGALLHQGHRRLLSHKRLLLGVLALAVAITANQAWAKPRPANATVTVWLHYTLSSSEYTTLALAALGVGGAVANQVLTTYKVYERRIDISHGIFFRKHQMIWLYDILDIQLVQTPMLMLAGSGSLLLQLDHQPQQQPGKRWHQPKSPQLRGFGSLSRLREMQKELLAEVETERRPMKKMWI